MQHGTGRTCAPEEVAHGVVQPGLHCTRFAEVQAVCARRRLGQRRGLSSRHRRRPLGERSGSCRKRRNRIQVTSMQVACVCAGQHGPAVAASADDSARASSSGGSGIISSSRAPSAPFASRPVGGILTEAHELLSKCSGTKSLGQRTCGWVSRGRGGRWHLMPRQQPMGAVWWSAWRRASWTATASCSAGVYE